VIHTESVDHELNSLKQAVNYDLYSPNERRILKNGIGFYKKAKEILVGKTASPFKKKLLIDTKSF